MLTTTNYINVYNSYSMLNLRIEVLPLVGPTTGSQVFASRESDHIARLTPTDFN